MPTMLQQKPFYKLKIEVDDMPLNPRKDYDNFGHMICWHSRYSLGDEHNYDEPKELLRQMIRERAVSGISTPKRKTAENKTEIPTATRNASPPIVGVPLFALCHSGPSVYIGCFALPERKGISLFSAKAVITVESKNTIAYKGKNLSSIPIPLFFAASVHKTVNYPFKPYSS